VNGDAWSALTPADNSAAICGVRRVLTIMVLKVNEAHEGKHASSSMRDARAHARVLQESGKGIWACRGPYAALSMVAGLLARTDTPTAVAHVQEFAELCWRSDALSACVSPYADDLECEGFRGAFEALETSLKESAGR
jgi:hypothetical protein